MSASSKKKLRKEQNAAAMTEKQQQEIKDAKNLKRYTVTFIVVMVLVLAITAGIALRTPITGAIARGTHSVTIGNHELSSAQLSYFYVDTIVNHYEQYSSYGNYASLYAMWMEGINFSSPVSKQIQDPATGKTWADYYIDQAIERATSVFAIYDKAMADPNFKLSDETSKYYDNFESYVEMYAQMNGFSTINGYLRNYYGAGAEIEQYKEYSKICDTAGEYFNMYMDSLDYKDEDFRKYETEKEKYDDYSSFKYSIFTINTSTYLTGGKESKDENGNTTITYTDEEKKAAVEAALADAKKLVENESITDYDMFAKAVKLLEKYKDKENVVSEKKNILYSQLNDEKMKEWLNSDERQPGDMTYIPIYETDKDGKETETVTGYYVLLFADRDENLTKLKNVRHILVKFSGGTKDDKTGEVKYSETEKKTAKDKADAILATWNALEKKDAEAFGKIAKEKSEDTGSKADGGLYEDIYPGQMVEAFENWCYDEARKEGDVEIIETEYGYHIMYFVGDSEISFRDFLIDIDMVNEEMERWEKELVDAMKIEKLTFFGINKDFFIK